ncbi:hypothetical protein JZ751_021442 [Albula glossodonta]|uniref:Uncharacterized protein n=1 Tax=Albula glossodonta TaxID=121402 RepID=A0A8T2MZ75_9TELE|nr:hypothetical protein JZ751_021442 [Albula glossodonta]
MCICFCIQADTDWLLAIVLSPTVFYHCHPLPSLNPPHFLFLSPTLPGSPAWAWAGSWSRQGLWWARPGQEQLVARGNRQVDGRCRVRRGASLAGLVHVDCVHGGPLHRPRGAEGPGVTGGARRLVHTRSSHGREKAGICALIWMVCFCCSSLSCLSFSCSCRRWMASCLCISRYFCHNMKHQEALHI